MKTAERTSGRGRDDGAAAVELALVLPILLFIVFATIDVGRLIETQVTLTQAAREGVRVWALGNGTSTGPSTADVQAAVDEAAAPLSAGSVTATTDACTSNARTDVSVAYTFHFITPVGAIASLFPGVPIDDSDLSLAAHGAMECER